MTVNGAKRIAAERDFEMRIAIQSFLEKHYGVKVVAGTHPIPRKYRDMHRRLGTWENPSWAPFVTPTTSDAATRAS